MSDVQQLVQGAIDELVASGAETGVQVAAYRNGELVVDAVAGVADSTTGRKVTSDTPFFSASTGKGISTAILHVLVERGAFDYDTRVTELWPEFGAHGKDKATVRHVLLHSVGVPGVPADTTPEDLCDFDKMVKIIAASEPWWEPGTQYGYHAQTFGFIAGELVRRATGKRISEYLADEIAAPLGVSGELYFAVPDDEKPRLARLDEHPAGAAMMSMLPPDFPLFKAAPPAVMPTAEFCNRDDVLGADIPAGATVTARAIAKLYAALLGEVDGVRLISAQRLTEITTLVTSDFDQMVCAPVPRALGYYLGRPGQDPAATASVFGWVGMGGSAAYADTATGVTFALTKNLFNPTESSAVEQVGNIVADHFAK